MDKIKSAQYDSIHTQQGVVNTGDATQIASDLILPAILIAAMYSDIKTHRISNRLILLGIIMCLLQAVGSGQSFKVLQVIKDLSIPVIVLYLLFLIRVIGAGDVKLLSLISGFMGIWFFFKVVLISFVIGAVWSLILLIQKKAFWQNMSVALNYAFDLVKGEAKPYDVASPERFQIEIPFAVCIGVAFGLIQLVECLKLA